MARRSDDEESPEQRARNAIRFADILQAEDNRRAKVTSRLNQRQSLVESGVPNTIIPPVSAITSSAPLDDASWSEAMGRAVRFAPRRPSKAVAASETGMPATNRAVNTPEQTAAIYGVENPRYGQPPAADIPQLYGGGDKSTIPVNGAAGYYDAKGNFLGPLYDDAGKKLPMPKGATGIRGTAGTTAPDTVQGQREVSGTTPLAPEAARALGFSGEPSVIAAKPFAMRTPYESSYLQGYEGGGGVERPQPTPGYRVGAALRTGAEKVAGLFGGGGNDIASGVSNSQAARIQQPTAANPVPVTPTSPKMNINKTPEAIPEALPLPDEWKNKRYEFSGF